MDEMNRRDLLLALAGMSALAALPIAARDAHADELDDVLAKVARARASLKTLVGPFTQTRKIGLLASEVRSTGTLMLVRPDRLRWELGSPDDVVYWILPEGLAYKSKNGQGRVQGGAGAKLAAERRFTGPWLHAAVMNIQVTGFASALPDAPLAPVVSVAVYVIPTVSGFWGVNVAVMLAVS